MKIAVLSAALALGLAGPALACEQHSSTMVVPSTDLNQTLVAPAVVAPATTVGPLNTIIDPLTDPVIQGRPVFDRLMTQPAVIDTRTELVRPMIIDHTMQLPAIYNNGGCCF